MKERIVPEEEINNLFIEFCKDLSAEGESVEEIRSYLDAHNMVVERGEDVHLIWFEYYEKGKVKYYSRPIEKYISNPEKEIKFYIKHNGPINMLHLPESALPTYHFNQKRKNKIPPAEEERQERKSQLSSCEWTIDWAFEASVFGYILLDELGIMYPEYNGDFYFKYKGRGDKRDSINKDVSLIKEVLSDKNKYSWYELGNKYFIVQKSNKREYQFLNAEWSQEIKTARIEGDKIVLEDIKEKPEEIGRIEKEIDFYLAKSDNSDLDRYIRYRNHSFGIIKTEKIPVRVENKKFSIFEQPDYRMESSYENHATNLTYEDVSKVVKEGNKYKWFEYHGSLYITRNYGKSKLRVVVGDYVSDRGEAIECQFKYSNSPYSMIMEFIDSGIWDGDKIKEKYNCSQLFIDSMVKELVRYKIIEESPDGSNQHKIHKYRQDLSYMVYQLESGLHL